MCNSNGIVAVWNSLPNIVVSAESTNIFKNCLDKFQVNQEFRFGLRADSTGIGSHSINSSIMRKSVYYVQIRT